MADAVRVTREIPVCAEVDVTVAGAGIAGVAAAIAAAREGARVVLVDRFGSLGGNMGPGMFSGGVLHLALQFPLGVQRLEGIPGEIINRCEGYGGGQLGHNYFKDSQAVSYVLFKMMQECGVRVMLNAHAADPLIERGAVTGLIVENRSGTQVVKTRILIDSTGDAETAARAGCPVDQGQSFVAPGMYFAIGNVDGDKYGAWLAESDVPEEDVRWAENIAAQLEAPRVTRVVPFYSLYRKAWYLGEYQFIKRIGEIATVCPDHGFYRVTDGFVGAQLGLRGPDLRSGSADMMTELEIGCRTYIYETALFMRRHVPGFENSYLFTVSPFFHARGGRAILGQAVVTERDEASGRNFDDVIFRSFGKVKPKRGEDGYDFPYRQLLPKGVRGLLAAGRSAILQPPYNRNRWKCLVMGQAAGIAAAMAVREDTSPDKIAVRELQRTLTFKYRSPVGSPKRLQSLGLLPRQKPTAKKAAARPKRKAAGRRRTAK